MAEVVLGSLYIAHCRAFNRTTGELTKLKLLLVGGELDDVERRIRWVLDYAAYDELSITDVEKIREKVHIFSSVTTFPDAPEKVVIDREGSQQPVRLPPNGLHVEQMRMYAVGLATTVFAVDEKHAARKAGSALSNHGSALSTSANRLSDGSTLTIEEIPKSSGIARARDVSSEINSARFVRG